MTQEYTPTDEVIKDAACFPKPTRLGEPYPIDPDDYDRWLATHDAELQADAWDEGFTNGRDLAASGQPMTRDNPYLEQEES